MIDRPKSLKARQKGMTTVTGVEGGDSEPRYWTSGLAVQPIPPNETQAQVN